jgi:hypothetical protein
LKLFPAVANIITTTITTTVIIGDATLLLPRSLSSVLPSLNILDFTVSEFVNSVDRRLM